MKGIVPILIFGLFAAAGVTLIYGLNEAINAYEDRHRAIWCRVYSEAPYLRPEERYRYELKCRRR